MKKTTLASQDLAKYQAEEKWIHLVIQFKKKGEYPDKQAYKQLPRQSKILLRDWDNLQVHEDILYHQKQQQPRQLILPSKLKPLVYNELHVNMGHLGTDRTTELIKSRFYWPLMDDEIKLFVTQVCPCVKRKKPHIMKAAAMQSISTSELLEIISMDFLHLDKSSGGYQYLLVLTDLFTKFTQVYATRNKEGKTAAERFYNDFILKFGLRGKILHDQGKEFDNNLFKHLAQFCNIKRIRTSPYHPQTNGQTERMNQTIINMLKILAERNKSNWKDHIQKLVHAYNCTTHSSIGYSPYYLLFGRTPKLPIDLIIPSPAADHEQTTHSSYVDKWKEQMTQAHEIANKQSMQRKSKDVERHNAKRLRASILLPWDRVLVRNMSERGGTGKLRSLWEDKVHIVLETYGENPVLYRVQAENDPNGRTRNLHCSILQPCDDLLDNFNWNLTKKDKRKAESTVENKTQKVEKHKEIQEESSEGELPQFTPAGMQPLIGDIRLSDRRTTTNNDQEVLPESLNISQENKQETPEQLQEVDFQRVSKNETLASETETSAPGGVKNFIYLKDDGFSQDKQKQNRVKDFIEVDDLMDHLNEESKKRQRQRRRIKNYIEVKDLKGHVKDRPRDAELNQQMTEHPPRKEYSLRSREKQSAVSNYVSQIVRSEVGQEQGRRHLNMVRTSSTSAGQDRRNQQQWSHHPEKETRIRQNMTNVSVISAPAKPDELAPHGRYNSGKASNHDRINDQCKTGHKIINDDNQRDLNMQFYETSRCYNQSETNMMPIYQRGDSVSNQPLTLPLPVVYPPQPLITTPSFSGFYYVVPIFQYWCPIALPNMMKM